MPDISSDSKLNKYFRKRHLEPATRNLYISAFHAYFKATGLTPTEAFNEADNEEEEAIRLKRRSINDHLDAFEDYLENNVKESTLKSYINVIRSFYRFHQIQLPDIIRRPPNPTPEESLKELPDREDIKKAINFSDIKYQAMIVLMASSGMRQGDVRSLTLKNFTDALSEYAKLTVKDLSDIEQTHDLLPEKTGPLTWNKWMEKKRRYYTCFSTPESMDYILKYLEWHPPKTYDDKTFIFRTYHTDQHIKRNTFNTYFEVLNRRCQFPDREGFIYFRPQNLRKFFGNQLKKTELGYIDTRHLMGHHVRDPTGRAYLKPDYDHLKKLYFKNMGVVTLFGKVEVYDMTDEKVRKVESENVKLKNEVETVAKEKNELARKIEMLSRRMDLMEKLEADEEYKERHP